MIKRYRPVLMFYHASKNQAVYEYCKHVRNKLIIQLVYSCFIKSCEMGLVTKERT